MTTDFSQRLDNLLETISWSEDELADKCGIARRTIRRWKTQKSSPNARSIDKITQATGVSKDWLVSDTGRMFSGCIDDQDLVFVKLTETWNNLSEKQKQKIMIIAEIIPPEIEAIRPSPPYRKDLCDWILLNAAKYAGRDTIDATSLPPALSEYINAGICDARCFWKCVAFYSDALRKEIESLLG
jgi:transcriptional regulator with XRE-family HTH domain